MENKTFWIQKTHLLRNDEYICSNCKFNADKAYKRCPACGAEMSKTKYNPSWVDEAEFLDMIFDD